MKKLIACLMGFALSPLVVAADAATTSTCASGLDTARIAELYAKKPAPMPFAAAPQLKLPEVLVASGVPAVYGVGIDGSHWRSVWDSLGTWDSATVLITKGGNAFEIETKISAGKPSTRSQYFNLAHDAPLGGHLRPDLITAIHAFQLPASEGMARGVLFYDASGESVYGVFVPGEGSEPSAKQLADFDRTWKLFKSLPARCPSA